MKRLLGLLSCLALLFCPVAGVRADDSDVFGSNIQPNILIFIDSSGSMDDNLPADPYDPAVTYTCSGCTYTATVVYQTKKKGGYGTYATTIAQVNSTAARAALSSVGHWSGKISGSNVTLFVGNYLNYVASPASAQEKKIVVAKRVLTNLINNTDGVRFGLAKFTGNGSQGPGGATIIADVGSSKTSLITALNGISPSGYTPLKGALHDMGTYYSGNMSGHASPIQYACQPNFVIMMSDGLQNGNGDVRAEATVQRTTDHASLLPDIQAVLTHTIGFAVAADEAAAANDVLQTTADNGGGTFYSTESEGQLEAALEDAIRQIMAATFMFATPVVPSTSATGIARAYMASFQSDPSRPFWRGYLKAFNRNENGLVQTTAQDTPDETCTLTFSDGTSKPCLAWEAGALLQLTAPGDRHIKVRSGTSLVDFNNTNVSAADLGVTTSTDRDKIINFIRGVDVNDENGDNNRTDDRPWKLGDIYHSTPVLVTPPLQPSTDPTYDVDFRTANAGRTTILLAGANDGMLHAFRETDGAELWAFIPPDVLPNLKNVAAASGEHQFYVDSSPVVADVKINGTWKTIVVFGQRRGGNSYYALDITNTEAPTYLWSFTDSKIAETWSEPVIGKVKMDPSAGKTGNQLYVAIFGGGYDTTTNDAHGKGVFVVDLATGAKLWEYYNDGSGADRQYMNYSIPANPLALDTNNDGYIDRVYIGDVGGQLWKFDLTTPARLTGGTSGTVNNADWLGKRFFRASSDTNPPASGEYYPTQAIYGGANAGLGQDHKLWVYFGTGDRNHPNNVAANRFYGIRDDQTSMANGAAWTESDLSDATSAAPDLVATHGWYFRLASNEKALTTPDIFNYVVFFTTFTSNTSTAACGSGGTANLYTVQMLTSFNALDLDTGEILGSNATASDTRAHSVGEGLLSGAFVIVNTNSDGSNRADIIFGGGDPPKLFDRLGPTPDTMRRILYWREAF